MNEISISVKRKTKEEPKLTLCINIHTPCPYNNIVSKKEIIHVPAIEVEISSTDKNIVEKISKSFLNALKNKWRIKE